jgi:hypothetical protein
MNNVPVVAHLDGHAVEASAFEQDTTPPTLDSFDLDMDKALLTLHFSEWMSYKSLSVTDVRLSMRKSVSPTQPDSFHDIDAESTVQEHDGTTLVVNISKTDMDEIKRKDDLVVLSNSTFIHVTSKFVADMNNQPLVLSSGMQSTVFTPDTTAPVLQAFYLDLTLNTLKMSFSETIDASTLSVSQTVLWSATESYTLNTSTLRQEPKDSLFVTIDLSVIDLNAIKVLKALAVSTPTTYLAVSSYLINDMNSRPVEEIKRTDSLGVSTFAPDRVAPEMDFFHLDMSYKRLSLAFSETVNASSIDVTQLTLRASDSHQEGFTLTHDSVVSTPERDSHMVDVIIGNNDANEIKKLPSLVRRKSASKLYFTAALLRDMNKNPIIKGTTSPLLSVSVFNPDVIAPVPIKFGVDMTKEQLYFEFDETVDAATLKPQSMTLQHPDLASISYTLLDGKSISSNGVFLTLNLTKPDVDAIKLLPMFTTMTDSEIVLASGTVNDTSIAATGSVQKKLGASTYLRDGTSPRLNAFAFNLTSHVLRMEFDEIVNASSLKPTAITLQSQKVRGGVPTFFTLTGGTCLSPNGLRVDVLLTDADINIIKDMEKLFVDDKSSFLAATKKLISDMASNAMVPVVASSALEVDSFVDDHTRPKLQSYGIDMDKETLSIYFTETIDVSTIDPTQITLHSTKLGASGGYTLTGGPLVSSDDNTSLTLSLIHADMNALKVKKIAISKGATWLSLTADTIKDMNNLTVMPRSGDSALQVRQFNADKTNPKLLSCSLNLTAETLHLSFSETVSTGSLDVGELTIQSEKSASSATISHALRLPSKTTATDFREFDISLSLTDLNEIKRLSQFGLAKSADSTNCVISDNFITDMYDLPVVAITSQKALLSVNFGTDTTPPKMTSFDITYNESVIEDLVYVSTIALHFKFSETVRFETYNPTAVTLHAAAKSGITTEKVTLGGYDVNVSMTSATSISFKLLRRDANKIKALSALSVDADSTFVSLTSAFAKDMYGNPLVAILDTSAKKVSQYTTDDSPPDLLRFTMDMDDGSLTLIFDETVNGKSINPDEITLRDHVDPALQNANYTLTGAYGENKVEWIKQSGKRSFPHSDKDIIKITFTKEDLDELKRLDICRNGFDGNDCFLVHTEFLVYDMMENDVARCT